jgi:hypothetical protein
VGAIDELPTTEMRISSAPSSSMPGKNVFAFATEGVGRSVVALQICFGSHRSPERNCAAAALDRGRINTFARKLDVDPEVLSRFGIGKPELARHRPRICGFNEDLL